MSDLYLVLRHRLGDMIEWVDLGVDVMRDARKRQGLSYETMARAIKVSAKTYERYEKAGRVPRWQLPKVAEVLELEIEWPEPMRVAVTSEVDPAAAVAEAEEILDRLARIERLLHELLGPPRDEPQSA